MALYIEAKWLTETEIYKKTMPVCPAPISARLKSRLEVLARNACRACGLRDYGGVDLRLRNGQPMVLDVNANCALSEELRASRYCACYGLGLCLGLGSAGANGGEARDGLPARIVDFLAATRRCMTPQVLPS